MMDVKTKILAGKQRIVAKSGDVINKLDNSDFVDRTYNITMLALSYGMVLFGAFGAVCYPIVGITNKSGLEKTAIMTALGLAMAAGGVCAAKKIHKEIMQDISREIHQKNRKDNKELKKELNGITEINMNPKTTLLIFQLHQHVN